MSSSPFGKLLSARKKKRKVAKATPTETLAPSEKSSGASSKKTKKPAPEIVLSADSANRQPGRPAPDKPALVKRKARVFNPAELQPKPDPGQPAPTSDAGQPVRPRLNRPAGARVRPRQNPRIATTGPVADPGLASGPVLVPDAGGPAARHLLLRPRPGRRPGAARKVPDQAARDVQDIAATANAADVGRLLEAERTTLEGRASSMSAADWATATRKFSERVGGIKKALPAVLSLIEELPLQRADCLSLLMSVNGDGDAETVRKRVLAAHSDATTNCASAVTRIEGSTLPELAALPLDEKLALLEDLRGGGGYADQDRRKAAMADLYLQTELDRNFADDDDEMRANALEEIQLTLLDADRNWATMGQDDRLKALRSALHIQAEWMQLPVDQRATIAVGTNMTRALPTGETVTLGGVFHHDSRTIEISGERLEHFDSIMDTVIHENTHNHQRWLVTQLEQGLIKPGDKRYRQVALFALNQGAGYHQGGNPLLLKADDDDAYEKQPTELHAHQAGADAALIMKEKANVRAADMKRRMDAWLLANSADPRATVVPDLQNLLQHAVSTGGSSTMLHRTVAYVEENFGKLTTPASI
jgi:hypothetical protein